MAKQWFLSGCLTLLALSESFLLHAHEPEQPITVEVNRGWDSTAACDASGAAGLWTFTVDNVIGKVSRVNIQVYKNALPTEVDGKLRVCAIYPDPLEREQEDRLCPRPVGAFESLGWVTINKPKKGDAGAMRLAPDSYCIRPVASGKGEITISIGHP